MTELKAKLDMNQEVFILQENKVLPVKVKGISVKLHEDINPEKPEERILVETVKYFLVSLVDKVTVEEKEYNDSNVGESVAILTKKIPLYGEEEQS